MGMRHTEEPACQIFSFYGRGAGLNEGMYPSGIHLHASATCYSPGIRLLSNRLLTSHLQVRSSACVESARMLESEGDALGAVIRGWQIDDRMSAATMRPDSIKAPTGYLDYISRY